MIKLLSDAGEPFGCVVPFYFRLSFSPGFYLTVMLRITIILCLLVFSCKPPAGKESVYLTGDYACTPCGYDCDKATHTGPGTCSQCTMPLVKKKSILHKDIRPEELCSTTDTNTILLDVRTVDEFNGTAAEKFRVLKNAVNIPVQELPQRIGELQKFKEKKFIVYCSHAHRSAAASYILTQNGFAHVFNMLGGMSVWKEEVKEDNCNQRLYSAQ